MFHSSSSGRNIAKIIIFSTVVAGTVFAYLSTQRCSLLYNNVHSGEVHGAVKKAALGGGHNEAYEDSFGFFDDIPNAEWYEIRNDSRSESLYIWPNSPHHGSDNMVGWLLNNVDPLFSCPRRRRIGAHNGRGDGGKWICDPHRLRSERKKDGCLIYSIGCSGDYSFEDQLVNLLQKNCEIHVFDPNPSFARPNDPALKSIHYHGWGMKSSYETREQLPADGIFRSVQETMQILGHAPNRTIDIFKIDCEGCEWANYKDWLSLDIRQLLIEIHPPMNPLGVSVVDFFNDIVYQSGLVPFSKEFNPLGAPAVYYEFSFIRMKKTYLLPS